MSTKSGAGRTFVTICVNNFNYERYVAEAIESALAQRYEPLEVVVVDDGSTDGSADVIRRYGDRVTAIIKENAGQGSAMNRGFDAARGDVVLFLDADDRLLPGAAEAVVAAFERRPELARVQFRLAVIDAQGRRTGVARPREGAPFPDGDLRQHRVRYRAHHWQPTSGNAYPRWFLERVMPVDEPMYRQNVDAYLNETSVLLGPIESLEETLGEYRFHGSNDSSANDLLDVGYLRRRIELIEAGHAAARRLAAGTDLEVPASAAELLDVAFLGYRLALLRLAPGDPRAGGEGRAFLVRRGIEAALRTPMLPPKQRAIRIAWFLAAGLLPASPAQRLIASWTPDTFRHSQRRFRRAVAAG